METSTINKNTIISAYMEFVLENETIPKTVFKFAKENNFEESDFYQYFSSFESLKKEIFTTFFNNTHELISKNEDYNSLDTKNKLLTFYYTFFELLTANRSYVLFALKEEKNKLERLKQLSELKKAFAEYIKSLDFKKIDLKKEALEKLQNKSLEELCWNQLLLTLKFWIEDTSPAFEKTDIYIEKSIHAGFDLINLTPLKNIIDFGKFIFKEMKTKF